jgi:hypothetical protein
MDGIREFFYWAASISLILVGLFMIALIAFLMYLKKLADRGMQRLDASLAHVHNATRTWRNLALTRFLIRALRLIF